MAGYQIYNHAISTGNTGANYPQKNKGLYIVPGTAAGNVAVTTYAIGGESGDVITVRWDTNASPFVFPIRFKSVGSVTGAGAAIYEIL